jgi:two-component system phosphate regulon response regulator PhoB
MLPGIDGLEVARRLKARPDNRNTPIVMLTAKGEEADIVTGLELGADDYVTKPFSPRILIARIKAVIRRRSGLVEAERDVLNIRELSIHVGRRRVTAADEALDLTYTEFQVLYFLARRPGWVFTRSQIVGLRKKLGPLGKYIETVRGVGYRFIEN